MATTYKVSYFNTKGNGEIIRLALTAAGLKFEDERLDREAWLKIKEKTPTKQMPLLTVTGANGKSTVYAQSSTCAKYIAKTNGLFGSTSEEEVVIDEVFECVSDFGKDFGKFLFEKDEARKEEQKKKVIEETLPRINQYINLRTKEFGKDGFIFGSKMTLADLHLYNIVDQVTSFQKDFFSEYPDLVAHADLVKKDPKIQAWIDTMPKPQS